MSALGEIISPSTGGRVGMGVKTRRACRSEPSGARLAPEYEYRARAIIRSSCAGQPAAAPNVAREFGRRA